MKRKFLCWLLTAALIQLIALPALAEAPTHGDSGAWIGEDALDTWVPEDYATDPATQADARAGLYNAFFLKDRLQTVSIQIGENNLNYLLQNALEEPYVMARSVTVGEITQGYCGLRTKGNYTLQHAYTDNPGSDRFSFTVHFGKFVKGQNFFGCDKISFNNFFFDRSMLKEYFSLLLMEEMGLPTPQFGLAKLYINGEYYGVYFMVEAMDFSILEQHFGVDKDQLSSYLCKPTGTRLLYSELQKDPAPLYAYDEDTKAKVEAMLPTAMEWARRLQCLSSGVDFEEQALDVQSQAYIDLLSQVMDVDGALRYFAVHSWLCQLDNMFVCQQNFGLYISPEGVSTLVPWDYDLSFGCYFPSTAEATANYPVDVMYKLNMQMWHTEPEQSAKYYRNFPLFYVLYQNRSLMERYRGYMLDCSKIAALGGTVEATGKSYDPAWFSSLLGALEEPLLEAAGEPLGEGVYYMNGIRQPKDVRKALPNLAMILSQRALGVYNQVTGSGGWVCASGCNLETLGNASWAGSSSEGLLTLVDPYTGIFTTGEYGGSNRSPAPVLNVRVLTQEDPVYQRALEQLQPGTGEQLTAYQLRSAVKPLEGYTVTVPLSREAMGEGAERAFYLLVGNKLEPLAVEQRGNLCTFRLDTLGTVVLLTKIPLLARMQAYLPMLLATAACVLTLTAVGVAARLRRKKDAMTE